MSESSKAPVGKKPGKAIGGSKGRGGETSIGVAPSTGFMSPVIVNIMYVAKDNQMGVRKEWRPSGLPPPGGKSGLWGLVTIMLSFLTRKVRFFKHFQNMNMPCQTLALDLWWL